MKSMIAILVLIFSVGSPAMAGNLQEELVAVEKSLWTAWGAKNGEVVRKHSTEDAVQIVAGTGMFVGRDAIAADIAGHDCELERFAFHDVKLRQPVADVAIVTYTATQDAMCDGKKLPARIQSTSVYVRQGGEWLQTSYQETPID